MVAKNHERVKHQSFDKHRFLEVRLVDVSRDRGWGSERNVHGTFLVTKSICESSLIQKTVESAVKESLKAVPEADKRCLKMLSEQVNPRALTAKYERDDLN